MSSWISVEELASRLRAHGLEPTSPRLKRLRSARILVHRRRPIGGGGSEVSYPESAVAVVRRAEELLSVRRSYDWVGWTMWVAGDAVDPSLGRRMLSEAAAAVDAALPGIRALLEEEDDATLARSLIRFLSPRGFPRF